MRVGVHQEPTGRGLGGADLVVAVATAELARAGHAVELVHHHPGGYRDRLAKFSGLPLGAVGERYVPRKPPAWLSLSGWRLGRALREYDADLSRGYDLFLTSTHALPPYCHAEHGMFYLHFPTADRLGSWPWGAPRRGPAGVIDRVRRRVYERLWEQALDTYQGRAANSRFTAGWAVRRWGVACDVLYPPVPPPAPPREKRNAIVTLGRFCPMKRQLDAVRAFAALTPALPGWELWCVGGVGDDDRVYYAEVEAAAAGVPGVRLMPDAPRAGVEAALGAAKIFWHLAGLGTDGEAEPWLAEHFGIATVEAMGAGCVPVVPDRGGQPELVEPGRTGFLCGTAADLLAATLRLAADDELRAGVAAAARRRAEDFGRQKFATGLLSLVARAAGRGGVR